MGCSMAQWWGAAWLSAGCSMAQWGVQHGLVWGAAWLSGGCSMAQWGVQHGLVLGCSMAQWLACWAAVRQPRVRIPPGTPPSAQQEENYLTRCRSHLPSSGRKNTQQETSRGRIMYMYRKKNYKINKKSAGHGTKI